MMELGFLIFFIFCFIYILSLILSPIGGCIFEQRYGPFDYSIIGSRDDGIIFLCLCPIVNTLFSIYAIIWCFLYFIKFIFVDLIYGFFRDVVFQIFTIKFWKTLYNKVKDFFISSFSGWGRRLKFLWSIFLLPFKNK